MNGALLFSHTSFTWLPLYIVLHATSDHQACRYFTLLKATWGSFLVRLKIKGKRAEGKGICSTHSKRCG